MNNITTVSPKETSSEFPILYKAANFPLILILGPVEKKIFPHFFLHDLINQSALNLSVLNIFAFPAAASVTFPRELKTWASSSSLKWRYYLVWGLNEVNHLTHTGQEYQLSTFINNHSQRPNHRLSCAY